MIKKDCSVFLVGEFRQFDSVEYTQLGSKWIISLEEYLRLERVLADRILAETKPFKLSELRMFVTLCHICPEVIGEVLGHTPEEWDEIRNRDPTEAQCAIPFAVSTTWF